MTGRPHEYVSVHDRLMGLPPVFRGADLTLRFGWTSKNASQYLYQWSRAGWVEGFGGRSDVYANLVVSRAPDWDAAAALAFPGAILSGIEPLRRAGWVTQCPALPEITLAPTDREFGVASFTLRRCSKSYWARLQPGIVTGAAGQLASLTPAWALVDLLKRESWGDCGLTPDDVYWDLLTPKDRRALAQAAHALGVPAEDIGEACPIGSAPRIARRSPTMGGP